MKETYYKIYCTEGGGKEPAGRIEPAGNVWEVRLEGALRYYLPGFSGSLGACFAYCDQEFACQIEKRERESSPLPFLLISSEGL